MLIFVLLGLISGVEAGTPIVLSSKAIAHEFTGHGGLSAGASSRLLRDYPLAQREDILDFLFLPNWGLGLEIIKVEIGGDAQSTDGTEPSHMHSRSDLSCTRGYELEIMKAARARNPKIKTFGLSWGAPGWINNGTFFGPEQVTYQTQWVTCMRSQGVSIDYLGVWNERYWGGPDYVKSLRAGLNAAGFAATQIIIPDGHYDESIMAAATSDPEFNASFDGVGLHYPCNVPAPEVQAGGKMYWASEDWWNQPDWGGAAAWGHLLTQNYVRMNMTSTISWSPLWAVYDALDDEQAGLILANEPWSGHWEVSPPVWTGAQWSQFTGVGWHFLSVPSGGSGELPEGGFYVSLVPPNGTGLTIILETLVSPRCPSPKTPQGPQTLTFQVLNTTRKSGTGGGDSPSLPAPGTRLHVWQTNQSAAFVNLGDIFISADGTFSVTVEPDSMMTVSTVSGARKGVPQAPIPPSAPFPFPYADDFSSVGEDGMAAYFADQFGSFAVRGGRLTQVATQNPGANGWTDNGDPLTILGDSQWRDYEVSMTVTAPAPPPPPPPPAHTLTDGLPAKLASCSTSAREQVWAWDGVAAGYVYGAATGECLNVYGCKSELVFWQCVTHGGTCCGADCYAGLQWARPDAEGYLISALGSSLCASAAEPVSVASPLTLAPCTGGTGQRWFFNESTGLLGLQGTGLCLSQPPPQPGYARVCGRTQGFDEFKPSNPLPGYCVEVGSDKSWRLTGGDKVMANGTMDTSSRWPVKVALSMMGPSIHAFVDSLVVASVNDSAYTEGRVAIGTSWGGEESFGDFFVSSGTGEMR